MLCVGVCCASSWYSECGVFCIICSFSMSVFDTSGDHMVETYSYMGLVMALYVTSFVSPMLLM